jgi:hypothetical protein
MSRYGINYYGLSTYGSSAAVQYVAGAFTAQSRGYGFIRIEWENPSGAWSNVRLIRNSYGYPVNAYDGDVLVNAARENNLTEYDDSTLAKGAFYYYSLFLYDTLTYSWVRAGNVTGVSVKNYNYGANMYKYMPDIYKLTQAYVASSEWDNDDLYNFLSLFGFQLDHAHTITNLLVNRYDLEKVGGVLIPSLLQQFGLTYEPEIGYQQSRILVRDAVQIGKKKGSAEGLRQFMKAFTGYAVPQPIAGTPNPSVDGLVVGENIMLDYNDSSFEESVGQWASSDSTATLTHLKKMDITAVSLTSNVVRLIIGSHAFKVGNKINTSGFTYPLFNTLGTQKTITAIDATSIYFALTANDVAQLPAYNNSTSSYPVVIPYPTPWDEPTTLTQYPNKQNGILAIKNSTASTATIKIECGLLNPVLKGVPVTTGLNYVFSVYSAAGSTLKGIVLKIRWYSRLGDFLSESTGSSVNNVVGDFSARPVVSDGAPADAYYAVPVITVVSAGATSLNEYHYFDCAQFEQSASVTDFDEARQIHMTLRASRINELLNPHFASPLTPWAVTGASTSVDATTKEPDVDVFSIAFKSLTSNVAMLETSVSHNLRPGDVVVVSGVGAPFDGTKTIATVRVNAANPTQVSKTFTYAVTNTNIVRVAATGTTYKSGDALKLTASGTSVLVKSTTTTADLMPIHYPSTSYTFSVYAQVATGTETVTPAIVWYDSSKVAIGSPISGTATAITATGTAWNRPSVTAIAPSNAAYAHVQLSWTAVIGEELWLDAALFENTSSISTYFDGSYGPATANDLFWEGGVVGGSRSHYYKHRYAIQDRLAGAALDSQLNTGTTVAIYLAQPKT